MSDVIDVVIPARNASKTIAGVVKPLADHPAIGDIFVIVNPPDRDTEEALSEFNGKNVFTQHIQADGKGEAVMYGMRMVTTTHVLFIDADITGLRSHHIGLLISDAVLDVHSLLIGIPDIPRNYPEERLWAWPWVSGQRCIPRRLIRPMLLHGYLMETQINRAASHAKYPIRFEWLIGCKSEFKMSPARIAKMQEDLKWAKERGILP
jgi:Glycosyl transferase family 2